MAGGLPVVKRSKPGHRSALFDPGAVERWVAQHARSEESLVAALCRVLDARARAAARVRMQLEDTHVLLEDALADVRAVAEMTCTRFARVPAELVPIVEAARAAGGEDGIRHVLDEHLRRVLDELGYDIAGSVRAAVDLAPCPVKRSTTVRDARAQLARLQAELLDVREQIVAGTAEWERRKRRDVRAGARFGGGVDA
jgi:hypothetical protein